MKHFQSIIAIICAMFAFAMMAYFTRQANTDILTIATWRAILVALLFFVAAFFNKELQFFSKDPATFQSFTPFCNQQGVP